jgi:hypothetical protein
MARSGKRARRCRCGGSSSSTLWELAEYDEEHDEDEEYDEEYDEKYDEEAHGRCSVAAPSDRRGWRTGR